MLFAAFFHFLLPSSHVLQRVRISAVDAVEIHLHPFAESPEKVDIAEAGDNKLLPWVCNSSTSSNCPWRFC